MPYPVSFPELYPRHFPQETENVLNQETGLHQWRAALARLRAGENTILNLNVFGESFTEGNGSDPTPANWLTRGYVGRLRAQLAALFGDVGTGLITPWYPSSAAFLAITSGTAWRLDSGYKLGPRKVCILGLSGVSNITWSMSGTGFVVAYPKGSVMGKFTYAVDGAAAVEIDAYNATNSMGTTAITGLSAGAHTIVFGRINDGKYAGIFGVYPTTDATRGVRVNNFAMGGMESAQFIASTDADVFYPHALSTDGPQYALLPPTLTILALILQDVNHSVSMATYKSNIQTLITKAKASGDVLLLNNGATPGLTDIKVESYGDVLKQLAIDNNCVYANYHAQMEPNSSLTVRGLINADGVHPNAVYARDLADWLLAILVEEALYTGV